MAVEGGGVALGMTLAEFTASFAVPSVDAAVNVDMADVLGGKADTIDGDSVISHLKLIKSPHIISGTSPDTGGTANTSTRIELDSNASAVDGAYDPAVVYLLSGTGAGQSRLIYEYDGTNKYAYVNRDWKVTPDSTTVYCITMNPGNTHVNEGVAQGGGNNTITLNTLASSQNNLYLGQIVFIVAGTGADQARMGVGYNGTTKVLTVDAPWTINPDTTSIYVMLPYPGFVHGVPTADSAANVLSRDVVGNKTDVASETADEASTIALLRQTLSVLGALTDAGSLAASISTVVALARMAAKEAWEAEQHQHSGRFGFGVAAAPSGETHVADRATTGGAGAAAGPLVLDAGNADWGTWTQVVGSADTPVAEISGATHYDMGAIVIVATEHESQRYMYQAVTQEDAPTDHPVDGDFATEGEFFIYAAAVQGDPVLPTVRLPNYRRPVGTKMWMRLRAPGQNTSTASFYLYGHFYTDPDT